MRGLRYGRASLVEQTVKPLLLGTALHKRKDEAAKIAGTAKAGRKVDQ
jgi:hypothetical protein